MAIDNKHRCQTHNMLAYKQMHRVEDHHNTIHSGHFMVSNVHDEKEDDDDSDTETSSGLLREAESGYNFAPANKETSTTYCFGPRSTHTMAIDATLTKLFKCMTLAYSGTITSPKWKTFRGLQMTVKDKIRLNNIIWREWHMQYVFRRQPVICQFATPLSDDIHSKPEAIVLEGKYWKRRLDTVTAEYKKWRRYFKHRRFPENHELHESHDALLEKLKEHDPLPRISQQQSSTDLMLPSDSEPMDFTDTLFQFHSLNQPFAFPNPREMSQYGCGDLIQPGLMQLQPNLDEFMDDTDLSDILMPNSRVFGPYGIQFSQDPDLTSAAMQMTTPADTSAIAMETDLGLMVQGYNQTGIHTINSLAYQLLSSLENAASQATITSQAPSPIPVSHQKTAQFISTTPSPSESAPNLKSVLTQRQTIPVQPTVLTTSAAPAQSPGRTNRTRGGRTTTATVTKEVSVSSPPSASKKDGFTVPTGKPLHSLRKQRTIAPAPTAMPSPSPSSQSTYLAQLLTKGTYPGAIINVKKEPDISSCVSPGVAATYTSIRPVEPLTLQSQTQIHSVPVTAPAPASISTFDFTKVKPDFPTSVLIAAASQALGTNSMTVKDVLSLTTNRNPVPVASPEIRNPIPAESSPQPTSLPSSPTADCLSPLPGSPPLFSLLGRECLEGKTPEQDKRRWAHLSAEQKRRCNLKVRQPTNQTGFDALLTLVPALGQNPKVSKAAMLQKTADYCKKLKQERSHMQKEAEILRQEIEALNTAISMVQSQLPATGVPVTRQRVDQMKEMFDDYVRKRTLQNWKFWIFSIIIGTLFDSFNSMVSTASIDELCRTVLAWLDQHCSLTALRPTVLNALRLLSTTTSILTEPARVREQATEAVTRRSSDAGSTRESPR